jgi:hypothetical protein
LRNPTAYPPDLNINEGPNANTPLTAAQYLNGNPFTAPSHTGQENRRILIMPIVNPQTSSSSSIQIVKFGAFLLRKKVKSNGSGAGDLVVEYLGDTYMVGHGSYDPNAAATNLSVPVLYR